MSSLTIKKNRRTHSLKMKEEVSVYKNHNKTSLDDIDIVAIHEWINKEKDIDLFSSLRAIALLCHIVEGLDILFFDIARELPSKLSLTDLSIDAFNENLRGLDEKKLTPFEYMKTVKTIFEKTKQSKEFMLGFDDNLLVEKLTILTKRFRLISEEEYQRLLDGEEPQASHLTDMTKKISKYQMLFEYANNIKFKRKVLRGEHEKNS